MTYTNTELDPKTDSSRERYLKWIGIAPDEPSFDQHTIKPSAITIYMETMRCVIDAIQVDSALRHELRRAIVNGVMNPLRGYFYLPDNFGEFKSSLAQSIGILRDVRDNYQSKLPADHPDKKNKTLGITYRSSMLRGMRAAFIAAAEHEGFTILPEQKSDKRISGPLTFVRKLIP